jgi:regulator of cell morphogenesis and NO signaling
VTDPALTASLAERPLGDLVRADARTAQVFERFGLDFCCGGRQTLREAADARGLALAEVVGAIAALGEPTLEDRDPATTKDLDALAEDIVSRHHAYVRSAAPAIEAWLDRLVERHGQRHPELHAIRQTFGDLAGDLQAHMLKEEHILFPFITDLAKAARTNGRPPLSPFGTILNPIRVMESDHARVGQWLGSLRTLSNGFTPPADACTTYRLCYAELERFEQDLHRHVHLEDHVLFPRAVDLERILV